MALSEMERERNKRIDWLTVTNTETEPATFGVRNPLSGELFTSGLDQLQQAGWVISDLKTYGEVQPQHQQYVKEPA